MSATATEATPRCKVSSLTNQTRYLASILREEFGEPFAFYDPATGEAIGASGSEGSLALASCGTPEQIKQWVSVGCAQAIHSREGQYQLVLPLTLKDTPPVVGIGSLTGFARTQVEVAREQARLQKWAQSVCDRLMLTAAAPVLHRKGHDQEGSGTLAWEAIGALEHLTRRLRFHKETEKNQMRILRSAADLLRVQTILWVPHQANGDILIWGKVGLSTWDCRQLAERLSKNPELGKTGFLMLNELQGSSLGTSFPRISNVLALAVRDQGPQGLLIAINKTLGTPANSLAKAQLPNQDGGVSPIAGSPVQATFTAVPLRRSDVVVLTPFAALFSLHVGVSARYHDLKELLVSLVRSLTAAIDAKDAYTFGHSERVGRVAVELGREMGLESDDVNDLYLAGLLHDIGKIGIRDGVLCKREALTPDEREHLQQHVTIGHAILIELHPIRHLLPGVLYHHERIDGAGYPEGLKGDAIPIIARILAVADAYDAMSTTRPYRQAMMHDRVETILREGAGTQWDKNVIDAFMRCRLKIHTIRQRGIGESLRQAVNGALRKGDSKHLDSLSCAMLPGEL